MSDNRIDVDILGSDQGLGNELSKVVTELQRVLALSTQVSTNFKESVKAAAELPATILKAKVALTQATEAGKTSDIERLTREIEQNTKRELDARREVAELRRQLAANAEARAVQQDQFGNQRVLGRSVDDTRTRNAVVSAYTTAINTDDAQMAARIADAAGKAAERLVKVAEASLIARFNQVGVTEQIRRDSYGNVGYAQAKINQGRIGIEKTLRDYGEGAPQNLAEVEARNVATANAKAQAVYDRSTAESINKEIDREARRAAVRERAAAEEENRQRNRDSKDGAVRERQAAEDENRTRDRIARRVALREYEAAQLENKQRDTDARQAALALRSDADAENRTRGQISKRAALREYAAAEEENRQRNRDSKDAALRERQAAEDENRERTRAARLAAVREYNAAQFENAERDRNSKITAVRERQAAEDENRQRTAAGRRAALREREAADAENKERARLDRQAGLNQRYEAEGENRRVTPEVAARLASRDTAFAAKYGIERSTFIQQTKDENKSIAEQAVLLRNLAEEKKRSNAVKPPKIELTPEERADRARVRNRESNDALNDRLSDNGGATFFALQSRIAANFAIFGAAVQGIRSAAGAIVEFDDVLKQFQAITDTTNKEMQTFRGQLLDIASTSKFTVNEIAQVAITLGQTGLSAADVAKALKPVVDLATASGSTLQQSVEAITSVLGAYSLEASRAGDVSDVFVGALNRTKLTMEQLQLGIQYAANIARDSGISFSELTATIGTISQAGVKSGSTIGTGVRQLITELTSPTDKLRGVLKELGISLADVDLKTNGLTGVLENLRTKGFTTADALRSLDLRAAAAYSALSGQGDRLKTLQQELLLTSAASDASTKANESLAAGFQRFQNSAFAVVDRALNPMVEALKGATGGAASLFGAFSQLGPILPILGTGLASIAAAATAVKLIGLVSGLAGSALVLPTLPVAIGVGALVALTAAVNQYGLFADAVEVARKRLDELKAAQNSVSGSISSVTTNLGSIDTTIQTLIDRREKLNEDGLLRKTAVIEAQRAFGELGLSISSNVGNIDELIGALQRLRGDMSKQLPDLFTNQSETIRKQIEQLRILQEEQAKSRRSRDENIGGDVLTTTTRPLQKFDALGSDFEKALGYIQNPTSLGNDANAAAGSAYSALTNAQNEARLRASQAIVDGNMKEAEKQNGRLKLLDELTELLRQAVGSQNNINAKVMEEERIRTEGAAKALLATDQFQNVSRDIENAYGARIRAERGIVANPLMDDIQKRDALMRSAQDSRAEGDRISSFFNDYLDQLIKNGADKSVVDQASAALKNRISELTKVVSDPIRQNFDAMEVGARALYESQRKVQQRQIDNALKTANTTQNPEEVAVQEEIIKDAVKKQSELLKKLADLKKANPESLDLDPIARQQLAADEEALRDTAEGYALRIGEIKKRIAKQLLDYRDQADDAQKARLQKEADRLTKQLNDPLTTEAKAKELVEAITNLLTQATEIVKRQNLTALERALIQAPAGAVLPNAGGQAIVGTAGDGSVAKQIIDAANSRGTDAEMTRYLLALSQLESRQQADAAARGSSARGILQFIDETWNGNPRTGAPGYGRGGDRFNVDQSVDAGIRFTRDNDAAFRREMNRDPTGEERFILHNQGSGGGLNLLNNPNSLASSQVSASAVTGNGGRLDMTSAEFVEVLKNMYRKAFGETEGQARSVKSTLEQASSDKDKAADEELLKKREEGEKRVAEIRRNSELLSLKALDKEQNARLQGEENLVKRAVTADDARAANLKAIGTLAELRSNALKEDELKPGNRTAEARKDDQDNLNRAFRERAETEAVVAAETVGKITLKVYDDQINNISARLKELDKDKSDGKYDITEYNDLKQKLEALKESRDIKGQISAYDAEIKSLNESMAEIESKGLGDRKDLLRITAQIAALEEKRKALAPGLAEQDRIRGTTPDLGLATGQAVDDFLKARGIEDSTGRMVSAVSQARKSIAADLAVIANSFDTLFTDLATGSISATDALKKFAQSIISGVLQQASKALTNSIFGAIFGSMGAGGGGGGSSIFSAISSFFSGSFGSGGFSGLANGGAIPGMAGGGEVTGAIPTRDSVLRRLVPGEVVMRRSAVQAVGRDNLLAINAMGNSFKSQSPKLNVAGLGSSASAKADVYILSPEQKPIPGKNDIVYAITEDIQTGGQMRRLIKSVAAGHDG